MWVGGGVPSVLPISDGLGLIGFLLEFWVSWRGRVVEGQEVLEMGKFEGWEEVAEEGTSGEAIHHGVFVSVIGHFEPDVFSAFPIRNHKGVAHGNGP
jgi:hypothetical protein